VVKKNSILRRDTNTSKQLQFRDIYFRNSRFVFLSLSGIYPRRSGPVDCFVMCYAALSHDDVQHLTSYITCHMSNM